MTKKDYIKIADLLGNKLECVGTWHSVEAYSLALAYLEDFIKLLELDNPRFNKSTFIKYINANYKTNISA
jgi:hypothetical protein